MHAAHDHHDGLTGYLFGGLYARSERIVRPQPPVERQYDRRVGAGGQDAAAKIAKLPLYHYLARRLGREATAEIGARVRVYGAGGYVYPEDDVARLSEEVHRFPELGFTHVKIKIVSPTG